VVELRRLFERTVAAFDKETNPVMTRTPGSGFGRRASNQGFGRL
jgi:hypothetical protein